MDGPSHNLADTGMTVEPAARIITERARRGLARSKSCAVRARHQQCTQARKRRDRRLDRCTYGEAILIQASGADLEDG
jgi:hypothetical protein